ncbi:MAG: hypothetical protein Q9160_004449 [Pyrenula sp. 1 TL-2023]
MILRRSTKIPSTIIWPITPDLTPQTSPILPDYWDPEDEKMSGTGPEQQAGQYMEVDNMDSVEAMSSSRAPSLTEILANTAPPPHTLAAFTGFLSQNHCLETLEFIMDAKKYHEKYETIAAFMAGMPITSDSEEGLELQQDWRRLLEIYITPGAPREINLPSEDRDDLLEFPHAVKAPPPEALEPAIRRMHDLMQESIFLPFINSFTSYTASSPAHLYPDYDPMSSDSMDVTPQPAYEGSQNMSRHASSRRRHRSPQSSSIDITSSRSPGPSFARPHSSNFSSTFRSTLTNPNVRHSAHLIQAPTSESGSGTITDDSGSASSPSNYGLDRDIITPPTTPPSSDLTASRESVHASPKSSRSESGGWKRMSQKLTMGWSKKRSAGHLREGGQGSTGGRLGPHEEERGG